MPESTPPELIGGRYRVRRTLGEGGMGAVYEAEHLELGRVVAVKVLLPQFSASQNMAARFMREARAAAQIGHPGIVQVFDLGTDGNLPFLVMEKLEGEELAARITREHPLPIEWATHTMIELCDALQAAHDHGIVHRDLKPSNVFLARQGRRVDVPKILDFGIAKLIHGADDIQTRTGQVFGTPMYMAPEQLRDSKDVDGRADVYSLGCLLFQMLVGKPPFEAPTYPDLIFRICSAPRPDPANLRGDVPRALAAAVQRAMAIDANERFATPALFAQALGAPAAPAVAPSESDLVASAPTELATSSSALTPHSRTLPTAGKSSLGVRVLVGVALLGGVAALVALKRASDTPQLATASPNALQAAATAKPELLPSAPAGVEPAASASTSSLAVAPAPSTSASAAHGASPAAHPAQHSAQHSTPSTPATGKPVGEAPPPLVPP